MMCIVRTQSGISFLKLSVNPVGATITHVPTKLHQFLISSFSVIVSTDTQTDI